MSFGAAGVVGTSFGLAKRNFFKVLGLYLLGGIVAILVSGIFGAASFSGFQGGPGNMGSMTATLFVGQVLAQIPLLAAGLAAIALLASDARGERISFTAAAKLGLRKTPISIVVSLLLGLIMAVAMIPVIGIVGAMGPESPAIVLVMLALFPFLLWLNAALLPVFPALVVEDRGVCAIKRGFSLSSGYRLAIIGSLLLLCLAIFAVVIVFGLGMGLVVGGAMQAPSATGGAMIVSMIVYVVMALFMAILGIAFQAAVYARLVECE